MSPKTEARIGKLQPQLPLVDGVPDEAFRNCVSPSDQDGDWHLDAHTREVGQRGIAAARALLRSASGRAA
jgi:hypothetical protein